MEHNRDFKDEGPVRHYQQWRFEKSWWWLAL